MSVKYYNQKGFSLMETMVALGIFVLIIFIVWAFVKQSYSVQNFSLGQATAISEAGRGVEKLVKEVREALPGDTGDYAIELADDNELIFYADYDSDQAIERVRYFLQGSEFIKGVTEATGYPLEYLAENETLSVLSHYVRNNINEPVFTYYDGTYSGKSGDVAMTTPADVLDLRLVHIFLKINVFPDRAPTDFNLESDAQVRNLKNNL